MTEEGDAAEIQIRQTEDQLEKCRIVSPISGTVLTKYAERGEVTAQGKPLFKVADMKHVFLRAYVGGDQLSAVKLGQAVKVYADYGAEDVRNTREKSRGYPDRPNLRLKPYRRVTNGRIWCTL